MIGIFIGSFNPPTMAHIDICLKLKNYFSKIIFIPVNSNEKYLASFTDRVNMLKIICRKYPFLEIDKIMEDYSYLNYRIIDLIKKKYGNISLIIGSDLLKKMDTFENYEALLNNNSFMIIERNKDSVKNILEEKYGNCRGKYVIMPFSSNISSSMARDKISAKEECKEILDKDIIDYIKKNNLYV